LSGPAAPTDTTDEQHDPHLDDAAAVSIDQRASFGISLLMTSARSAM
jgi:hypothetical protein